MSTKKEKFKVAQISPLRWERVQDEGRTAVSNLLNELGFDEDRNFQVKVSKTIVTLRQPELAPLIKEKVFGDGLEPM